MNTRLQPLTAHSRDTEIRICRSDGSPILSQFAGTDKRPFIHPIVAPDGRGIMTEDTPSHHHPWQHGLYVGLNDVNGIGFWEEGLKGKPMDGTFRPRPIRHLELEGSTAVWTVETEWCDPEGGRMIDEPQQWTFMTSKTATSSIRTGC